MARPGGPPSDPGSRGDRYAGGVSLCEAIGRIAGPEATVTPGIALSPPPTSDTDSQRDHCAGDVTVCGACRGIPTTKGTVMQAFASFGGPPPD